MFGSDGKTNSNSRSSGYQPEILMIDTQYNDNSGNSYSDVFWVVALVQAVGELEFGEQQVSYKFKPDGCLVA
ncbi:hypothetical protein ACS0TY_033728 [Phlomoides rotata]